MARWVGVGTQWPLVGFEPATYSRDRKSCTVPLGHRAPEWPKQKQKIYKEETKTNASAQDSKSKICEGSPNGTRKVIEERFVELNRRFLSLEKRPSVINGESENRECNEIWKWCVQDDVNHGTEQDEVDGEKKGADFTDRQTDR